MGTYLWRFVYICLDKNTRSLKIISNQNVHLFLNCANQWQVWHSSSMTTDNLLYLKVVPGNRLPEVIKESCLIAMFSVKDEDHLHGEREDGHCLST